jgi:protein-disulfide isomerase
MKISHLVVIFAVIFAAGCTGSDDVKTCDDGKLTKTEEMVLANSTFNYIEQVYLAPQGISGEIEDIESFGDVYLIKFTFGGASMPPQETEAYVTSDGKLLMVQGIVDTTVIPDMDAAHPETPAPTEAPAQTRVTVDIDDDYCLGEEDAPVTIVEFSDYQCPYCQRFWSQTLPQIKSEYVEKGLVKFIYRDFPLGFHPNAQKAAEATECAGDQGKFWEMQDTLFAGLAEWSGSGDPSTVFKRYAAELELDEDAFAECLDGGKYTEETQKDLSDGSAAGVSGTPAFFVNGVFITGAQPYETFKAIIDAELAENGVNSTITGNCTGK